MDVPELVVAVAAALTGVQGVRDAPAKPVDQMPSGGVYAYVWPAAGALREITAGRVQGQHTLHALVATPLRNLRTDWDRIVPFFGPAWRALLAAGLGLQEDALRYTFGEMDLGGGQLIGWRFELDIMTVAALVAEAEEEG